MITRRNPERETRLIFDALEELPGRVRSPYLRDVAARLEVGQHLYGDRWAITPINRLLDELIEEALDLTCWSVLARQRLDLDPPNPEEHHRIVNALSVAIRAGAVAYGHLIGLDKGRAGR